ncbi:uncharacterized protein [Amphiura filiformis]|uniref:uncharacterized protein n=1 Tax=Amphiura filiformis TaxID=82378 RepID=UPI003B2241A9
MIYKRRGEILVLLTACLWTVLDAYTCDLLEAYDPVSGKTRFALPSAERCYCTRVLPPVRKLSNKCNTYNKDKMESLWFTDYPGLLTKRENWTPEKLDELLERKQFCETQNVEPVVDTATLHCKRWTGHHTVPTGQPKQTEGLTTVTNEAVSTGAPGSTTPGLSNRGPTTPGSTTSGSIIQGSTTPESTTLGMLTF